jgi:amino acid adenylation domain-containing protein
MNVLHELLERTADRYPDHCAVSDDHARLTYRELCDDSRRLAAWLIVAGVHRGDRVVVALPSGVFLPVLLYACSRAGGAFVVLRADTPAAVAAHVLDDAEPRLVIGDSPVLRDLALARGIAHRGSADCVAARERPSSRPPAGPVAVDPICLVYTSGSTAMPKAVVSTHQQLLFATSAIQSQLGYRPDDTVYCVLPPSFDYGLYQVFLATLAGARLHLAEPGRAGHRLLVELRATDASVLPLVPSLAVNLTRLLARRPAPLPRLRLLTSTGAAMPPGVLGAVRDLLPGAAVQLMYGLTECKRATIMPKDEDLRRPGACGRALPGTEVFVVDADGNRLPAGETGEVVVRGPNVMAGYWRRPELTAQRFPRVDGLFPQLNTGDYGWLDDGGYLYFAGRRDDQYKERGFRVSTTEVEAAAHRVPGVDTAVVVPPADGAEGATLLVQGTLTAAEVLAALRAQIDEVKVPARCVVVPELPLNAHGKVERRGLAALLGDG